MSLRIFRWHQDGHEKSYWLTVWRIVINGTFCPQKYYGRCCKRDKSAMRNGATVPERSRAQTLARYQGVKNRIMIFAEGCFNGKGGIFKKSLAAGNVYIKPNRIESEILRK